MENTRNLPEIVLRSLYWCPNPDLKEVYVDIVLTLSNGEQVTIPKGFITDMATVPRLLWSIVAPSGDHDLAVVVHDWLLYKGRSRLIADQEMLFWLKQSSVRKSKTNVMYFCVRSYSNIKSVPKKFRITKY